MKRKEDYAARGLLSNQRIKLKSSREQIFEETGYKQTESVRGDNECIANTSCDLKAKRKN